MKVRGLRGFTIVEVLILVAILMILASMGLIPLRNKMEAYRIESDTRSIQGLIQSYRTLAFTQKKEFEFKLKSGGSKACIDNASGDEVRCVSLNKTWQMNVDKITISSRGTISSGGTVYYDSKGLATVDCIKASLTRVRAGKWTGSECNVK